MNFTGQFYSENEVNIKHEPYQNDFVDVCSTEDNNENKENASAEHASLKSPCKKNCLISTFSRMSPFKVRQSTSQTLNLCPTLPTKSSTVKASLMQRFSNFKTQNLSQSSSSPPLLSPPPPPPTTTTTNNELGFCNEIESNKSVKENLKTIKLEKNVLPFTTINNSNCTNYNNQWNFNTKTDLLSGLYNTGERNFSLINPVMSNNNNNNNNIKNENSFPSTLLCLKTTTCTTTVTPQVEECKQFYEFQKKQFDSSRDPATISNDDAESETEEAVLNETVNSNKGVKASRKEKSLGKLCRRFLLTMGDEAKASTNDVHLESVARKMNVEKRRIYDIVNVMEALEAMSKTNKSFYRWHGLAALPQLMHALQKEAIEAKFPERIMQVERAMCSFTELSSVNTTNSNIRRSASTSKLVVASSEIVGSMTDENSFGKSPSNISLNNTLREYSNLSQTFNDEEWMLQSAENSLNNSSTSIFSNDSARISQSDGERSVGSGGSGKNSLAQLCRRFLMVLLCNPKDRRRVSLDVASTVLIKDPESEGFEPPSRSRCRRLYDIANVLVAMELIKKVHYLFGTKKIPLFVYCGPEPDASPITAELSMREFLDRIGLSAINSTNPENNTENINRQQIFGDLLTKSTYSSQENRKFRIPKIQQQQQQQSDSKMHLTTNDICSSENMPPPLAPKFVCSLEEQRPLSKATSSELSSASRSLSSSTSSLSSTLSQPSSSSSMQYLAEMAELVRKRLHSTTSTLSAPIFDRKYTNKCDTENKDNKTPTKSFRYKRQKISNLLSSTEHNNGFCTKNLAPKVEENNEITDLPKPKPVIPLTSLNFVPPSHPQQQHQQQNGLIGGSITTSAMAAAMNELLMGISSRIDSVTPPAALEFPTPYSAQNNSNLYFGDVSLSYFAIPSTLTTTTTVTSVSVPTITQQNYENSFNQRQNCFSKPKVAHSVLSILGVSQSENIITNNLPPTSAFLSSSPKAFKPIRHQNNNN